MAGLYFGFVGDFSSLDLPEQVSFNRDIRPILSDKCYACHGPDARARKAELRLDDREAALARRPGYDKPAIVPGSPRKSALVERITHRDPEKRMPPPEKDEAGSGGEPLTERETALLIRWIEQGAPWEKHWAYEPIRRPEVPDIPHPSNPPRNPIDHFIAARLPELGLEPSPEADRSTLLRRASFDLTGLPPTVEEVEAFLSDSDPEAYEKLVDRLLASPHYGERMAVWWLDLVRYADTIGYHSDIHKRIWPYRDYVIQAFNENKPFDQFTREQLAGDLIPEASREQIVASAFNRLGQFTAEGGSQPKEYLAIYQADWVRTVSTTWLGSTMGCAECHDHKFDPFTQKDFYSMAAFFTELKKRGVYPNDPFFPPERALAPRVPPADLKEFEALKEKVHYLKRNKKDKEQEYLATQDRLDRLADRLHVTMVSEPVEPRKIRILPRGNWQDDSGPIVEPDVPEVLGDLKVKGRRPDRLDLADWLVSRENPLTARVIVNQLWKEFFGTGLSRTVEDLGSQGEWPTHPELLDWLAAEFVDSGWNVKHMVRLMVTSRTYRQSSQPTPEMRQRDPNNRYLARQSRFRLRAEFVRDNALAVSGLLSRKIGGPSVKPYQPQDYWKDIQTFGTAGPATEWVPSEGEDQYRRGLYTYWKRTFVHPSLVAFDAPSRQECTGERPVSNTPLQSLVLLNDPTYVEAARVFAQNLLAQDFSDFESRLRWAFLRALSREPKAEEVEELRQLYQRQRERYQERTEAAWKLVQVGQYAVPEEANAREVAAWTAVTRTILNLHETITRY